MSNVNNNSNHELGYSTKSYTIGFILSIVFTIIPFMAIKTNGLSNLSIIIIVFATAIIQLLIQLIFFMHLNAEKKPRYHSASFIFTMFLMLIVVIGSIWIMASLAYRMHPIMNHMMH